MPELAPYACLDEASRGRRYPEPPPQLRSEYQRDRDRIVHSAAFRRLEYKTQVFVNHEGDLYRTRLTHSLEVAQIGRTIARIMGLNEDLTEAIALAHDLGHTPFGHAGQDALNHCMRDYGGFEHNLQSLRVVDELEEKYAEFRGLNLTFETREGILKHCSHARAAQLGEVGRRFIEGGQPGLEAQVTNLADEIAYNSHDVDDGLRSGLLSLEQLNEVTLFAGQYEVVTRSYPDLPERRVIHEVVRRMISRQVVDLVEASLERLEQAEPADSNAVRLAGGPLIGFSEAMAAENRELKRFLFNSLYRHYRVHRMSSKAKRLIADLFEVFMDDPRLLPPEPQRRVTEKETHQGPRGRAQAIADYIAGMTDRYAIAEHRRVFDPQG
jgi:dGTPase